MINLINNNDPLKSAISFCITVLILFHFVNNSFIDSETSAIEQITFDELSESFLNTPQSASASKLNLKLLSGAYSDNFASWYYHTKRLSLFTKIFSIISETDSEQNIRQSTFLVIQSSTST